MAKSQLVPTDHGIQIEGFVSHNPSFGSIVGASPSLELLVERDYPFAHEAGVFVPDTNDLFVTSNCLQDKKGASYVTITKVSVWGSAHETTCEVIPWTGGYDDNAGASNSICMASGGVNWGNDKILFCAQGNKTLPSGLFTMTVTEPYGREALLTGFHGRPFNSVSDAIVARSDGCIWFTDSSYGYEHGFRPSPSLPDQVYRFDPREGSVRVVADGFAHPNGLCFSPDESILYVTDTGKVRGGGTVDARKPATIYAFDVVYYSSQPFLTNRRLFAMTESGVPDGIKCDTDGNVYSGCGNGVNVWSPGGVLLGVIALRGGVTNLCFGRAGELFMLNENKLWRARISPRVTGAQLRL
ncbi:uncharacterized protein PV09_06058 [Verruconis gallopava]|uniref:SMP-30/Gluconolactonase/LRE-like region domain-containing protein n=1 Tax=Verruconis gallopava TaxID=253628 RepID=A0A0D2A7S4_9PEZI|nr:uncharacterized protein PV09_06058 [Verruconis gallopava]KIW02610.1 hypothetical protein PV09_06058 [Verruconis gallopava]